jgi:hypothetical protein
MGWYEKTGFDAGMFVSEKGIATAGDRLSSDRPYAIEPAPTD